MIDIHNHKLTRDQWAFLELVNRTPAENVLGWKRMSEPIAAVFEGLNLPKDLIFHMTKADETGTVHGYVYLSPSGEALIKYGTYAR